MVFTPDLENKATRHGIEIDDIYRNENGISFQLSHMQKVLTGKESGLRSSAKVFSEIVQIYRSEPDRYQSILQEGMAMAGGSQEVNLKEPFIHWLSERVSMKMLSDIYIMFDDIERFCLEQGVLQQPLFETVSLQTLQKVKDAIERNREFRLSYKGQLSKMSSAIRYYMVYVSEHIPQTNPEDSMRATVVGDTTRINQVEAVECAATAQRTIPVKQQNTVEAVNPVDVPKSNRVVFIGWLKDQGEKASGIFPYLSSISQTSNFAVENKLSNQDIFTIHSPEIVEKLISLLLENNTFKSRNTQQKQRPVEALKKYLRFCETHSRDTVEETESADTKAEVDLTIPENPTGINEGETNAQDADPSNTAFESSHASSDTQQEQDLTIEQRYNAILQSDFPDGLRPISLRLRKFKNAYAQRYGAELLITNEELEAQLRRVGALIGDRIYARQSTDDMGIIKELLSSVDSAFASGATCVYLESILSRYGTELANELNIYNIESLNSFLTQSLNPAYCITSEYISKRGTPADPASDVQNVLEESLQPLNYSELQRRMWYVPLDKIKLFLVRIPSVANVDSETYFFAPNLPITPEEMNTITVAMQREIDRRGFLVAKDIPELMKQHCPSAAMNTADFKDWGLRNVLRILLADKFSFSGSLICSKGQYMDMERAYRNFCAERERLTIDELKEFSKEVNVQIYWDSVMHEMVRISQQELVRQDLIHFDTDAIDAVLDHLCPGNFVPIHEIELFLQFPVSEVPWNGYVLESYLLNFSDNFVLWQTNISASGYYGVIARASAPYSSYRDVIIDVLAHSDNWKDEKTALDLLVKAGCQARRRYENFGEVLKEARMRREKLEAMK